MKKNIIKKRLKYSAENTRYSRNVNLFEWFDTSTEINPAVYQNKIAETRLVIFGVGGIGGTVAEIMARMGTMQFVLIDFDRIEDSNITRQSCYTEADIGLSKVACAKKYIQNINADASVITHKLRIESMADIEKCALIDEQKQLILCCVDTPEEINRCFDEFALKHQQAYVVESYGATAINTYTVHPPYTMTDEQIFSDNIIPMDQWVLQNRAMPTSVTAPISFMAASLVALEVQKFITGLGYQKIFTQINVIKNTVHQWDIDATNATDDMCKGDAL